MGLRLRRLAESSEQPCHECGRQWFNQPGIAMQWEERPYFELRGSLGHCLVTTVICPSCGDALIDALWPGVSTLAILRDNREWEADSVRGVLLRCRSDEQEAS